MHFRREGVTVGNKIVCKKRIIMFQTKDPIDMYASRREVLHVVLDSIFKNAFFLSLCSFSWNLDI